MKDFLLAEYKTIILVLLFCGGVFAWFYWQELQKDAEKLAEKQWSYSCMEPGKWGDQYKLGDVAPAFDSSWEKTSDLTGIVSWRHSGGDMVVNVKNNKIHTIEIYPKGDRMRECSEDFSNWSKSNSPGSSPITFEGKTYTRYPGVVFITAMQDGVNVNAGWIVNQVL